MLLCLGGLLRRLSRLLLCLGGLLRRLSRLLLCLSRLLLCLSALLLCLSGLLLRLEVVAAPDGHSVGRRAGNGRDRYRRAAVTVGEADASTEGGQPRNCRYYDRGALKLTHSMTLS
ncbi:hypothetical protein [Streptomyces sp. NPDC002884]|uniref:hypothetical protein n=1 Tax=Streptomyces sp. NPDC002884 TaxID=3154544 RepID=UPI00333130E2